MGMLYRSKNGKIAGVCAGIAEHFNLDTRQLRLIWLVLAIAGLGSPVLFYLILWLVMPPAPGVGYEERMRERLGKK